MNLKELSDVLGLSPTTISRALNGYPEVNARTRQRVIEAAKKYRYAANTMARRLATGRAMGIAHVVPLGEHDMINPTFAEFISGAGEAYSHAGYNMVLSVVSQGNEADTYRTMAATRTVDGVIVHAPRLDDPRIPLLMEIDLPFLVHGRTEVSDGYSWLDIRNTAAFRDATRHLTALGHRRIALLNGMAQMMFAVRRRKGHLDALAEIGLEPDPDLLFSAEMTEPYGYETARALLMRRDRPTAFLASGLMVALGINRAVAEAGLVLGRDVSLVTHDDVTSFLPNAGAVPMFTATKSSLRAAGRRSAQMLIDVIEGRAEGRQTELWDAELIVGRSTGPVEG